MELLLAVTLMLRLRNHTFYRPLFFLPLSHLFAYELTRSNGVYCCITASIAQFSSPVSRLSTCQSLHPLFPQNMPAELLHMNHNAYLQMNKKKLYLTGLTCLRFKVGHMMYQLCQCDLHLQRYMICRSIHINSRNIWLA